MAQIPEAPAKLAKGAARQGSLREHNLSLVLADIVRNGEAPSRAEISAHTGLTRATVSALVDRLITARLVTELAPSQSQKAGRPAVPLIPAAGTVAAIGLEVNVDYLGLIALDLAGQVLTTHLVEGDFRHSSPEPVLTQLADLTSMVVKELQARDISVLGLGLALPGLVDRVAGPMRHAPNLGWRDLDVAALMAAGPTLPVLPLRMANEANLAALAEANALLAIDCTSFLYVSGEVGIGAAIMLSGRIMPGQHGWSGELGHTAIELVGRQCTCGATGCLEQYAGKDALMTAAGLDLQLPVGVLLEAWERGDTEAVDALALAGRALGVALANFVNLVDVDTVVLGGIYAELGEALIPVVQQHLSARVLSAGWAPPTVRPALTDRYAAMTGGALTILHELIADPSPWMQGI